MISRYMTRHNVVINNRKWERSEDDRLRRLIAHCRINNYIPWTKVADQDQPGFIYVAMQAEWSTLVDLLDVCKYLSGENTSRTPRS